MASPNHIYKLLIKEHHLDTFGHVNNATYLQLFEEARWDWITQNSYGLDRIKQTGLGPVVLEINIGFRKEVTLRQEICIETFSLGYKGKIARVRQDIYNLNRQVCCSAEFTFGLFDTASRKLVSPTEEWLKALEITTL